MSLHDLRNTLVCTGSLLSSTVLGWLGGPHVLLTALCWLIVIDYVSGVLAAQYKGICFDWTTAMRGVWKKLLYFFVVLFAAVMDNALAAKEINISTGGKLRVAFLVVLIGIEASSILRHFGACDITIPQWIKQIVKSMKDGKGGDEDE